MVAIKPPLGSLNAVAGVALALATIRIPERRQAFRRAATPGGQSSILLNVVRSEVHALSNILTRAPVDGEADRAQHIITEPIRITVNAIVSAGSDTPLDSNTAFFSGMDFRNRVDDQSNPTATQIIRKAQLAAQVGITGNFTGVRNHATFWARLQALNAEKTPFEYLSDLQVYREMIFSSIVVERDSAEWIEFTAELEEFRTAGVTRDRWLTPEQTDASMDGTDAGTKTTPEISVQEATPNILDRQAFPGDENVQVLTG